MAERKASAIAGIPAPGAFVFPDHLLYLRFVLKEIEKPRNRVLAREPVAKVFENRLLLSSIIETPFSKDVLSQLLGHGGSPGDKV